MRYAIEWLESSSEEIRGVDDVDDIFLSGKAPIRLRITVEFDSVEEASIIGKALKVDDDEFIRTAVEGRTVRGLVEARTLESARRAADDWMACLLSVMRKDEKT